MKWLLREPFRIFPPFGRSFDPRTRPLMAGDCPGAARFCTFAIESAPLPGTCSPPSVRNEASALSKDRDPQHDLGPRPPGWPVGSTEIDGALKIGHKSVHY